MEDNDDKSKDKGAKITRLVPKTGPGSGVANDKPGEVLSINRGASISMERNTAEAIYVEQFVRVQSSLEHVEELLLLFGEDPSVSKETTNRIAKNIPNGKEDRLVIQTVIIVSVEQP